MKVYAVFFALSLINNIHPSTTAHVRSSTYLPNASTIKGTKQTVFFNNSTPFITLNCNCSNQVIQWLVNGSLCKVFLWERAIINKNNSLCFNCSRQYLTLYPPFPCIRFSCVGTGHGPSYYHNWFLQKTEQLPLLAPTNYTSAYFDRSHFSESYFYQNNPLFTVLAIILLVSFNFALLTYFPSYI